MGKSNLDTSGGLQLTPNICDSVSFEQFLPNVAHYQEPITWGLHKSSFSHFSVYFDLFSNLTTEGNWVSANRK